MQELAARAHKLVDRFDHVHGNTYRTCLVSNRTGDCLPDPPCRVGAEFITSAIFKFINRLHQADIAFLNEVKKLQTAVGVFFGDGNNEAQIGFNHFLFGDTRFAFALLYHVYDAAEFSKRHAGIGCNIRYLAADTLNALSLIGGKGRPFLVDVRHICEPVFVKLMAHIAIKKRFTRYFVPLCQAQHLATQSSQAAIERI